MGASDRANPIDAMDSILCMDFTQTPTLVTLSDTSNESAQLSAGYYRLYSDVDCFVIQGDTGLTATASHHPIKAAESYHFPVTGTDDDYVAGVTGGAAGTLFLCPMKAL